MLIKKLIIVVINTLFPFPTSGQVTEISHRLGSRGGAHQVIPIKRNTSLKYQSMSENYNKQ